MPTITASQDTVKALIAMARIRHGYNIRPVSRFESLEDCVAMDVGKAILWYNTPDHSTHIVTLYLF